MPKEDNISGAGKSFLLRKELIVASAFSLALFLFCLLFDGCTEHKRIMFLLTLPVLWAGRAIAYSAFRNLKGAFISADLLMTAGAGTAFILSAVQAFRPGQDCDCQNTYFESVAAIITLTLLGKYLTASAGGEARKKAQNALAPLPENARMIFEGKEKEVPVARLRPGDQVKVKTGEVTPADGMVTDGTSEVREALLTESRIVRKFPGDMIAAGAMAVSGDLVVKVSKAVKGSLAHKFFSMLRPGRKPGATMADRFTSLYLPAVAAMALSTFAVWALGFSDGMARAMILAMEVVVVACPSALAIAVPLARRAAFEKLADKGILVRNFDAMDKMQEVGVVVINRSAVTASGRPAVAEVRWKGDASRRKHFASVIYSMVQWSGSAAEASVAGHFSGRYGAVPLEVGDVERFEGGIRAKIGGTTYYWGTEAFIGMVNHGRLFKKEEFLIHEVSGMEYFFDDEALKKEVRKLKDLGLTVYLAADEKAVFAVTGLGEDLRDHAVDMIRSLKDLGMKAVLLADTADVPAQRAAAALGVTEVYAEVLPFAKADIVRRFQEEGKTVAYIGEREEDGPALVQADVSFCLVTGPDAPAGSADIVLQEKALPYISEVVRYSVSMRRVVRSNIFWAAFFSVCGILLASGVLFPLTGITLTSSIAGILQGLGIMAVVASNLKVKSL